MIFSTDSYLKSLSFEIKTLKDLEKVKVIAPKLGSNTRKLLDDFFESKEINFEPAYEVTSSLVRLQFALNDNGIAIGYKRYIENEVKSRIEACLVYENEIKGEIKMKKLIRKILF